ncbi:hypothetical protein BU24DRAFT_467731 [Aaosphaeria arxii CBS 175.79]|uniref:Uncharacterized protein n=1 Tax=Aaosphaeria arxii CBS 175.79 TaxID=1450172 RepID=A0A6A5XB16_9PLEO|nr:uncharacterized protein BU24DRAFT_467731 [Aaosphaeria arxii CBS 175.79]KAF2010265.1 hypothetical protein BU24DRAFT_467731 [Aaosphaeria arxii CBS 175.79]
MAQQTQPSAVLTLRDHTDFTNWMTQLEARCVAYNIWSKIDPSSTEIPLREPIKPVLPKAADYTPAANVEIPQRPSDLSAGARGRIRRTSNTTNYKARNTRAINGSTIKNKRHGNISSRSYSPRCHRISRAPAASPNYRYDNG